MRRYAQSLNLLIITIIMVAVTGLSTAGECNSNCNSNTSTMSTITPTSEYDSNLREATTQDIYNRSLYLDQLHAEKYKNITSSKLGGYVNTEQFKNPALTLFVAYASINRTPSLYTELYIPSIIKDNAIISVGSTGVGVSETTNFNMNNISNSTISNYNECNVTTDSHDITNSNVTTIIGSNVTTITDSHDNITTITDSHDTYDSHNIIYQNNTTIIYYYNGVPQK